MCGSDAGQTRREEAEGLKSNGTRIRTQDMGRKSWDEKASLLEPTVEDESRRSSLSIVTSAGRCLPPRFVSSFTT